MSATVRATEGTASPRLPHLPLESDGPPRNLMWQRGVSPDRARGRWRGDVWEKGPDTSSQKDRGPSSPTRLRFGRARTDQFHPRTGSPGTASPEAQLYPD